MNDTSEIADRSWHEFLDEHNGIKHLPAALLTTIQYAFKVGFCHGGDYACGATARGVRRILDEVASQ